MLIVRQSTARTVTVGPVLDADGVAVTDGVVADFKISKNGGAPAALNGSATLTHRHTGHYSLALTTSDLDTVGQAEIVIDDTVNACAPKELTVIEEAVYDALFAASAAGYSTYAGADTSGTTTLLSRLTSTRAGYLDNLSAGAVATAAKLLSYFQSALRKDVTVDADIGGNYDDATDSQEALRDRGDAAWITATGFSTLDAAGVRTAVGLTSANLDDQLGAIGAKTDNLPSDPADASVVAGLIAAVEAKVDTVDTVVDGIKAVTDALPDAGALTSLATAANLATVDGVADAIKAKTDKLTFDGDNALDANVQKVNDVTLDGDGTVGNPWGPA